MWRLALADISPVWRQIHVHPLHPPLTWHTAADLPFIPPCPSDAPTPSPLSHPRSKCEREDDACRRAFIHCDPDITAFDPPEHSSSTMTVDSDGTYESLRRTYDYEGYNVAHSSFSVLKSIPEGASKRPSSPDTSWHGDFGPVRTPLVRTVPHTARRLLGTQCWVTGCLTRATELEWTTTREGRGVFVRTLACERHVSDEGTPESILNSVLSTPPSKDQTHFGVQTVIRPLCDDLSCQKSGYQWYSGPLTQCHTHAMRSAVSKEPYRSLASVYEDVKRGSAAQEELLRHMCLGTSNITFCFSRKLPDADLCPTCADHVARPLHCRPYDGNTRTIERCSGVTASWKTHCCDDHEKCRAKSERCLSCSMPIGLTTRSKLTKDLPEVVQMTTGLCEECWDEFGFGSTDPTFSASVQGRECKKPFWLDVEVQKMRNNRFNSFCDSLAESDV